MCIPVRTLSVAKRPTKIMKVLIKDLHRNTNNRDIFIGVVLIRRPVPIPVVHTPRLGCRQHRFAQYGTLLLHGQWYDVYSR